MNARLALAVALPFLACAVQWLLWDTLKPYVWFVFFPATFFSAWLGGIKGGLAATVIGALLAWYVFMPSASALTLDHPAEVFSIAMFVFMGGLFAIFFDNLRQAIQATDQALAEARNANEKVTQLYQKTLELDTQKNQFFANVSHELRTPLTLILAPLEQRLRRAASADFPQAERRETESMLRNARLLYRHVTDLLDAAKLDAGRMALAWSQLDLADLVRAIASCFDALAVERRIDYSVTAPANLPAELDAEKLQRVVLNLLSNAFKFTPDGGVIALHLSSGDGQALIDVRDNGPGVPAALRAAVFERFRQGDGDTRRRHGGTGLGLSIVKDFVELHGGTVSLGEAPGGGALVSLRLPLAAPAGTVVGAPLARDEVIDRQVVEELQARVPLAIPDQDSGAASAVEAPLVLVVEDNLDMNEFIAAALRPHYRVASAFDGREGLDQALLLHPDLILADVMMPRMSGDEMALELRRQPATADVPIVMLTARADDELRVRLLEQGVQSVLNKPFAVAELLARVGGLVASRRRTTAELSRSAAAAFESEQRFRATFEQAAVGIALVAPDGRWLRANQRLCDIVGYGFHELLTRSLRDITHPDDRDAGRDCERQLLAGEIGHCATEKRCLRKDGTVIWINLTMALVCRPDGRPDYFIAVVEDIQRRKAAEAEIRLLNTDLERRVERRTAELVAANEELDGFAYSVSHDLRAPLRAMSGFALALAADHGAKLDGEARLYLDQIGIASCRMRELIDGLLDLSRSTRGDLRRDAIDISALAARLLLELTRGEPGRVVATDIEPGLAADGDAGMVEVALRNLLDNAWKYTGRTAAASIRVYTGEVGGRTGICVADNGAGFDMARVDQLFQPFRRLHREEEFPGIGIGLATVRRIVRRHGGEIRAHGVPGRGARFCFSLGGAIGCESGAA